VQPVVPTPLEPHETIQATQPTYVWSAVANADSYVLEILSCRYGYGCDWFSGPLDVPAAGNCGSSQCTYTPSMSLECGKYKWTIKAIGPGGESGPAELTFTVQSGAPAIPQGSEPVGPVATRQPTLRWPHVAGATRYWFFVQNGATWQQILNDEKGASELGCDSGECSVRLASRSITLPDGEYMWEVISMSECGWSEAGERHFTVATPCGNGTCDAGETNATCPEDCTCGNGVCDWERGETANKCPSDCWCGDGVCDSTESLQTCAVDCSWCGDRICSGNENANNCFEDCY
jgi:hypothetical protein